MAAGAGGAGRLCGRREAEVSEDRARHHRVLLGGDDPQPAAAAWEQQWPSETSESREGDPRKRQHGAAASRRRPAEAPSLTPVVPQLGRVV